MTTTFDPIFSPLKASADRQVLKYAAGTAIFCPCCGAVMDARRTVAATLPDGRTIVRCGKCWDDIAAALTPATLAKLDVVDGRVVFRRQRAAKEKK